MENKTIRVAAYCRVSTDMEEQEGSYGLQRQYYKELIQSNPEMKLAGIYGDKGKSGLTIAKRPGLLKLVEDCRANKVDLIVTKSVSRLSRNMSECAALVTELSGYGVELWFEKENINTREEKSALLMHIFSAIAEEESNSISQHAIQAHEQYVQEGRPLGTIAYGYRNAGDHHWEIDEEQAAVVMKAFQMAGQGKCYASILYELNKMEPEGCRWNQERLKRMLTSLVYKGDYFSHAIISVRPGKKVKNRNYRDRYYLVGHHEPIVPAELFDRVQRIIERGLLNSHRNLSDEDVEFFESLDERTQGEQKQIHRERTERFCGGIAPFGYVREGGQLNKDPLIEPVVQQMFIKAQAGEHATDIAFWLEDEGVQSPRGSSRWSDSTVRDILKNSVYVDDIIGRELFNDVQKRFRSREETDGSKQGVYQGLVFCGSCARKMAYHGIGGKDRRKTANYTCKYHTGANPKGQPLDQMPRIDEDVLCAEVLRQFGNCYPSMQEKLVTREEPFAQNEEQGESAKRLLRSITVYPDGKVEVQF